MRLFPPLFLRLFILCIVISFTPGCRRLNAHQTAVAHNGGGSSLLAPGKILFVLTASDKQELKNGKSRDTGYFLGEFYEAYGALHDQGYQIEIATVGGRLPAVDPESLKDKYWQEPAWRDTALKFVTSERMFKSPLSIEQVLSSSHEYQGLIVPGGQGVMDDLLDDSESHRLVLTMAERGKAIGLICHAPAILARLPEGQHVLSGRKVTSVSPFEEFYIETFVMGGDAKVRKIGRQLRRAGYKYDSALPKSNHAIRDCSLVTSQNPFSGPAFNEMFLPALRASRAGVPCDAS